MSVEAPVFVPQEATKQPEINRPSEPFLTWDILDRSRHAQLWDLPEEDLEAARSALVIDTFPELTLQQKRTFLAYRLWEITGKFALIKEYIGETEGPKLDSLLDQVWDNKKNLEKYEEVSEYFELMDELFASNTRDIPRFMILIKRVQKYRSEGLGNDEILARKSEDNKNIRSKVYSYLRLKRGGLDNAAIAQKLRIRIEEVLVIEKELIESGFLNDRSTEERFANLINDGRTMRQASRVLGIDRFTARKLKRKLIFEGRVEANPGRREYSEEFIAFCLRVENLRKSHPEMKRIGMEEELNCTPARLDEAIYVLGITGRVNKITRADRRREIDVQDEDAIVGLRIGSPELSQRDISVKTGIPRHRVAYFISRAIRNNRIPRKRELILKPRN